jgi:hypothetical protein
MLTTVVQYARKPQLVGFRPERSMKRGSAEPRAHSRPEASAARTLCVYTIGYPQLRGQVYEFMYTVAYGDIWLPRPMYIARETGFLNHV